MKRSVWALLAMWCVPAAAAAQGTDTSLDLQHYRPAAGVVQYLGDVRGAEIEPHQMVGFSLFLNYQHKPFLLTLLEDDGTGTRVPRNYDAIQYQVAADFLWSLGLFNYVQIGLGLPVVLAQDGVGAQPTDPERPTLATTAVRDLRLDIQARILGHGPRGTVGRGFGLAGALVLAMPTGDSDNFAGDANVVFDPILIADYDLGFFSAAVNFGARLRKQSTFADYDLSHQLTWGAGAAVKILDERLRILAEYTGLYNVAGTSATSQELRFGAGYTFDSNRDLTVLAGGGFGIGDKPGTPEFRVLLSFVYAPLNRDVDEDTIYDRDDECLEGERAQEDLDGFEDEDGCSDWDNDEDTINDFDDECPDEAEDLDDYEDEDGCTDPDNDGDGVPDETDECADEMEDQDGFEDEDGCPDPDNDGDQVPDESDACGDSAEDLDGWEDEDGCADPDNDGDTIPDAEDACANEPETANGYKDEDGCPDLAPVTVDTLPAGIDGAALTRAFATLRRDVRTCAPGQAGTARALVTIEGASGRVTAVEVSGDVQGEPAECIAEKLRAATFPTFSDPAALAVSYPYQLGR
ncbi:MAG: thrombospondin [Deltaproteobacteria bacterium]|nr:thrombospondin [Deltaproteobacteria bacterium]